MKLICFFQSSKAKDILFLPFYFVCLVIQRGGQSLTQRRLSLLLVLYIYSAEEETFVPIPDVPADLPAQISAAIQHLHQMGSGVHPNIPSDLLLKSRWPVQARFM